jgi:hypothetical protein
MTSLNSLDSPTRNPSSLRWSGILALASLVSLTAVDDAKSQIIWDGGKVETVLTASGQSLPASLFVSTTAPEILASDILGGERDVLFELYASNPLVTGASSGNGVYIGYDPSFFGGNYIDTARSGGVAGKATIVWDGIDGSPDINYTGLGGVNLAGQHSGFQFNVITDSNPGSWEFKFYTDEFHYSNYIVNFGASSVNLPGTHYEVLFNNMVASGSLGGADFSNIGAIVVVGDSSAALDSALINYGFMPVPEPSTAFLASISLIFLLGRRRKGR